jgi:hypothetical protein
MLIWGSIGCAVMAIFCIVEGAIDTIVPDTRLLSFLFGGVAAFMAVLLGCFFGDQFSRALKNRTTLEDLAQEGPQYDLGRFDNLRQVFGSSRFGILCPMPNRELSGFEWSLPAYQNPNLVSTSERYV